MGFSGYEFAKIAVRSVFEIKSSEMVSELRFIIVETVFNCDRLPLLAAQSNSHEIPFIHQDGPNPIDFLHKYPELVLNDVVSHYDA